jgi:hypothetical protein
MRIFWIIAILLLGSVFVFTACSSSTEPKPFPPPEGYSSWQEYEEAYNKKTTSSPVQVTPIRTTPTPQATTQPPKTVPVAPTTSTPLQKSDFLITVISTRQVTLTNNSPSTVQVYKFSMTYDFYSSIQYNMPGKPNPYYGPIVRGILSSDDASQLNPRQSSAKTFNRNDIVAIVSCSFYVRSDSQELIITYGK